MEGSAPSLRPNPAIVTPSARELDPAGPALTPIPNGLKSCLEGADQMEPFFPGPASLGPVADELALGRSRMCLLQDLCVLDHVVILFESPLPSGYPPSPVPRLLQSSQNASHLSAFPEWRNRMV